MNSPSQIVWLVMLVANVLIINNVQGQSCAGCTSSNPCTSRTLSVGYYRALSWADSYRASQVKFGVYASQGAVTWKILSYDNYALYAAGSSYISAASSTSSTSCTQPTYTFSALRGPYVIIICSSSSTGSCNLQYYASATDSCSSYSSCSTCIAASYCGYCTGSATCKSGTSTSDWESYCTGSGWAWSSCSSSSGCSYSTCSTCANVASCGWCTYSSQCSAGTSSGPNSGTCYSGWTWSSSSCPVVPCYSYTTCSSCSSASSCGWCLADNICYTGSSSGPTSGYCSSGWTWVPSSCSSTTTKVNVGGIVGGVVGGVVGLSILAFVLYRCSTNSSASRSVNLAEHQPSNPIFLQANPPPQPLTVQPVEGICCPPSSTAAAGGYAYQGSYPAGGAQQGELGYPPAQYPPYPPQEPIYPPQEPIYAPQYPTPQYPMQQYPPPPDAPPQQYAPNNNYSAYNPPPPSTDQPALDNGGAGPRV